MLGALQVGQVLERGHLCQHNGVDGIGISIIVCITCDDRAGLILARGLVQPDVQRVIAGGIRDPDLRNVEPRDLDGVLECSRTADHGVEDIGIVG